MTLPAGEPKLEKAAGLPPEPLRDLMALGGWKELQTAVKA